MVEARLFQALSDPTRLRILTLLALEPINVSGMVERLGCAQPAVSRHLRVLRDVALIRDRRMGKEVEYSLNHDQLNEAAEYLDSLLTNARVGTLREQTAVPARPEVAQESPAAARPEEGAGHGTAVVGRGEASKKVRRTPGPKKKPQAGHTAMPKARKRATAKAAARTKPRKAEVAKAPARSKARKKAAKAPARTKPRKAVTEATPEREPAFVVERDKGDTESMDDFLL
jgi:DNA-binding transcriptional ArsR family regulator